MYKGFRIMLQLVSNIIYVHNVAASLEFFRTVFSIDQQYVSQEGNDSANIIAENLMITFLSYESARNHMKELGIKHEIAGPSGFELFVLVDNVEEVYERALLLHATSLREPVESSEGDVLCYVQTPDNIIIQIGKIAEKNTSEDDDCGCDEESCENTHTNPVILPRGQA
jgi:hypothetical protein